MTTDNTVFDKAGKQLFVGDYIIYGHNLGRCAGLKFGKVLSLEHEVENRGYNGKEWLYNTYKIGVQGVDDDFSGEPTLSRKSYLLYPDRIFVISFDQLPEYAKKLYEEQT